MMRPWPDLSSWGATLSLPPDVRLRLLRRDELLTLPSRIDAWYPTVRVGSESVFRDVGFLTQHVTHEGRETDLLAFYIEQAGEVVGFMSFERHPADLSLHARLGFLSPEARTGFLGALGFMLFEALGRAVGAELLSTWVTLASTHQQFFARRRGFTLSGLVPGHDRDLMPDGTVRRVMEALYTKELGTEPSLIPDQACLLPETWAMLARLRGETSGPR
jgi:hypothetical protein